MPKTVGISDSMHTLVGEKKLELFKKYKITVKIADIVNAAIKSGIDNVDEVFVPKYMMARLREEEKEKGNNGEI
jgi:hypothetical protein